MVNVPLIWHYFFGGGGGIGAEPKDSHELNIGETPGKNTAGLLDVLPGMTYHDGHHSLFEGYDFQPATQLQKPLCGR